MFDLIIFPLSLDTGREQYELPGLLVIGAPRRAARMRAQDQLVLYCKLITTSNGGANSISSPVAGGGLTTSQQREILSRLAETYFAFSGSVTAGLRAVAARLNDFLLARNLKASQEGQTVGILNLAVIHGDRLVVAHAGATHSFLLTKNQVVHFDDSQGGRGLGLSRQANQRFYQTTLEAGDLLVVCADPPASWTSKTLANSPQLSFEHLRRRLLGEVGADLQVGVIRFQAGKGQISFWRPGEGQRTAGRKAGEGRSASHPVPSTPRTLSGVAAVQVDPQNIQPAGGETSPVPAATEINASLSAEKATDPQEISNLKPASTLESASSIPDQGPVSGENGKNQERAGIFLGETVSTKLTEQDTPLPPTPRPVRQEPAVQDGSPAALNSAIGTTQAQPGSMKGTDQQRQTQPPRRSRQTKESGSGREVNRGASRLPLKARVVSERPVQSGPNAFQKGLAAIWMLIGVTILRIRTRTRQLTRPLWAKVGGGLSVAAARVIPRKMDARGHPEPFFNLSSSQMLAVALIIPLVVVTIATTVYFQSGRSEQFQLRFVEAQQFAQQAGQQQDPSQQRESWKKAYAMLLEADKFGQSTEAQALKQQAVSTLDGLEGFVRLNYQPVVRGGFPPDVNITRMVATLNDVYLLDASEGRILRLYRTASGYEIDPTFNCGAGKAGTVIVNPLIDLAALPPNNDMHSTVMGIDTGGNLVYCSPNQAGFDTRPLALPDSGWGAIVGMALNNDTLYVLDPKANAVYRYDGQNGVFSERPHLYFDATIPQMNDVIDLAVDQEFLYLLHDGGRMTVCESSGFEYTATKCTDPAPYGDTRPGYEPAPLTFSEANFTQIQTTQPPDPSLFALDAANKSIYHLSLRRLNLQRQYRPMPDGDFPLPNESPTAFTISPNRRALLAFRNQVFFATIP